MVTFDTNVWIRLFTGDEVEQAARAQALYILHAQGDGIAVPILVTAEIEWVLSRSYAWPRERIHNVLCELRHTRGVGFEATEAVERALGDYIQGKCSLADYLLAEASPHFFSFDKQLVRESKAVAA